MKKSWCDVRITSEVWNYRSPKPSNLLTIKCFHFSDFFFKQCYYFSSNSFHMNAKWTSLILAWSWRSFEWEHYDLACYCFHRFAESLLWLILIHPLKTYKSSIHLCPMLFSKIYVGVAGNILLWWCMLANIFEYFLLSMTKFLPVLCHFFHCMESFKLNLIMNKWEKVIFWPEQTCLINFSLGFPDGQLAVSSNMWHILAATYATLASYSDKTQRGCGTCEAWRWLFCFMLSALRSDWIPYCICILFL